MDMIRKKKSLSIQLNGHLAFATALFFLGQSNFNYAMDVPSPTASAFPISGVVIGLDTQIISEALQSPDPRVRREAILSLAYAHVVNPIEILTLASQDPSPQVRLAALRVASSSFPSLGTAFLIQRGLIDEDPIVRLGAAHSVHAYRNFGPYGSLLLSALASPDPEVSWVGMPNHLPWRPYSGVFHGESSPSSPRWVLDYGGDSPLGRRPRLNVNDEGDVRMGLIPQSRAVIAGAPVPRVFNLYDLHNSSKSILQNRLRRNYVSSHLFFLTVDYFKAQEIVDQARSDAQSEGQYQINYDFIAEDPFFHRHSLDIHQVYPAPLTLEEWVAMRDALKTYPEVVEMGSDFDRLFQSVTVLADDSELQKQTKETIQKRIKRLFDFAQSQEASGQSGVSAASPGGDLALRLMGNLDRCIDGLQAGLSDLEKDYFAEGEPESAGDFISRVFTDYKMEFIEKHGNLRPRSSEFRTTVVQNLRQRMLYSLGLRGTEAEVAYPFLGNPEIAELKPKRVMARFLGGERTQLSGEAAVVEFEAFSIDHMVRLLQASRERGLMNSEGNGLLHPEAMGTKLKSSLIQQIALDDYTLAGAYRDFFSDPHQHSEYFAPPPADELSSNIRLKDRFWLHLLEANGYIQR